MCSGQKVLLNKSLPTCIILSTFGKKKTTKRNPKHTFRSNMHTLHFKMFGQTQASILIEMLNNS